MSKNSRPIPEGQAGSSRVAGDVEAMGILEKALLPATVQSLEENTPSFEKRLQLMMDIATLVYPDLAAKALEAMGH